MSIRAQRTVFVVVGILLTIYEAFGETGYVSISWNMVLILEWMGVGFLLYGGYLWTRIKNRHWVWMLTMLFFPVGIFVLSILKGKRDSIESRQGKWAISGVAVFGFFVIIKWLIPPEEMLDTILTEAIVVLPLAIICGLVAVIRGRIKRRKMR